MREDIDLHRSQKNFNCAAGRSCCRLHRCTLSLLADYVRNRHQIAAGRSLLRLKEVSATLYFILLDPDRSAAVRLEKGDPAVQQFDGSHLMFVAAGSDPFDAITNAVKAVERHLQTFSHRDRKKMPDMLNWFGWCTWDTFYTEVTAEAVREGLQRNQMQTNDRNEERYQSKIGTVTAELEEMKQSLEKSKEEGNLMAYYLHSLQKELQ